MMERAMERARELAQTRQARALDAVAARIRETFPRASVTPETDAVAVSGRGLLGRWLQSAELRFLSSVLR
jgi:hypothetical protein